ncbi:hypothetical protein A1O3_01774 [Capronia epimyces CBS 606.96]|uniref:Transcription factor domain-containing protein n=1 Tax=Capronia epimyces CBS 606.96 TaxID=1182542 RepID=W9YJY1_9EURO|nr:uncharacterized protein A1O3_01774 [Capronia epimyces CBS 606.96]EXJ93217.1 hypothetical protein A1O3_01774 [Capronia epimyces CBS 606.96]
MPGLQQQQQQQQQQQDSPHSLLLPSERHPLAVSEISCQRHSPFTPLSLPLRDLVDLYFHFVHNGPHTLFHEASFYSELEAGSIPEMLPLAMASLSARFSANPFFENVDPRSRGRSYADHAMDLLHRKMLDPSLHTVQTCVIIAHFLGGEGEVKGKHIYLGLARLHAQTIRLWEMPAHSSIITREIHRRTMLSVTMAGNWSAADMSTRTLSPEDPESIIPLIDDVDFLALGPDSMSTSTTGPNMLQANKSMWAQMALTIDIYGRICDVVSGLSHKRRTLQSYHDDIADLAAELSRWGASLPPNLTYTMTNLARYANLGLGRTFASMHIGYHHFWQMLYYPFLNLRQHQQLPPQLHEIYAEDKYAMMCKEHAMLVSDIAKVAFKTSGCELVWYLNGHILVVSSSVHLHTLLFSESLAETDMARERLISNFEILMQLKMYWPVTDLSVSRLRTFQNSCRMSTSDPFVLDEWMLKFLMEHTANVPLSRPMAEYPPHKEPSESALPDLPDSLHERRRSSQLTNSEWKGRTLGDTSSSSLSTILHQKDISNEAVVENALSWLLGYDSAGSLDSSQPGFS